MSRKGWKGVERTAAALFGLKRWPANMGGRVDFGGNPQDAYVGQVKNPKSLSLAQLTDLALEMEEIGCPRAQYGVVVAKLSVKKPTPHLVVMTETTWLAMRAQLERDNEELRELRDFWNANRNTVVETANASPSKERERTQIGKATERLRQSTSAPSTSTESQ